MNHRSMAFVRRMACYHRLSGWSAAQTLPLKRICNSAVFPGQLSFYSAGTSADINERILNVLKTFEKIDASKLTMDSNMERDLGLDSLDRVEAIIAIEEEFDLQIPDRIADTIKTPSDVAAFIRQEQERARIQ